MMLTGKISKNALMNNIISKLALIFFSNKAVNKKKDKKKPRYSMLCYIMHVHCSFFQLSFQPNLCNS